MQFEGFTQADFDVFALEGFEERMATLRSRIRPKLAALGGALTPFLRRRLGPEVYPHVASHLRRRVNPPDDTWVAFARTRRGYKAYAHLTVGIQAPGVYVRLIVKEDSEDKARLGACLEADAEALACRLGEDTLLRLTGMAPSEADWVGGSGLDAGYLREWGAALREDRAACFRAGFDLDRSEPALAAGPSFLARVEPLLDRLVPWYECAVVGPNAKMEGGAR